MNLHTWAKPWGFLLLAMCAASAWAQAEQSRFEQGLLWRIERSGKPVGHLLGTLHLPDERLLKFPPAVLSAFQGADLVATEIAMDANNIQKLLLAMSYTDGRTLEAVAGKKLYGGVSGLLAKVGLPDAAVQRMKPWAAMTMLIMPARTDALPMDLVFYQAAAQAGKNQAALETIEEQVAVFEAEPLKTQLLMLEEVVNNHAQVTALTQRMVDAYLQRDLAALEALADNEELLTSAESRRIHRAMRGRMIERRNVVMARRIEPLLEKGNTFIAVGALHLPGANGLLAHLQRRGYRITRAD
jgi:uncharacterized protein YbaP (TraB family)